MKLKGKGNFILRTRDRGFRLVSKGLPAAGMSSEPFPAPVGRGEARQVRGKPSERGPLDALSGACRVVRGLSKHYAVRDQTPGSPVNFRMHRHPGANRFRTEARLISTFADFHVNAQTPMTALL
jgi:hypothetical protein